MFKKIKKNIYDGWELKHFDNSKNFRKYQYELIKNFISGYTAEIGPGNGENLKFYMHKCKKIDLYEPSENLFKNLKKKFKSKKIYLKNKKFYKSKNKYNTIIYLDVLEHIKKDEKEIQNALISLKKGGNLVINVPAFQHLYSKFDKDVGHFRRYNQTDIKLIANKFNHKIKYIRYYDSVGYFLSLLSKIFIKNYKKNFEKKIKFWNSLIYISKLLDKALFYSIGKSLVIIINKN